MLHSYTNPRSSEFVKLVIEHFWENHGEQRHEGMLPKLALFAATIKELQEELRPAVESALSDLGVPTSRILVNVGDNKLTSNDDLREFINLDTPTSEKQFILLVNKGKKGGTVDRCLAWHFTGSRDRKSLSYKRVCDAYVRLARDNRPDTSTSQKKTHRFSMTSCNRTSA